MGKSAPIISWKSAQCTMKCLHRDKNWRDLLLFAIGCGTAYRVSDYRAITWSWLMDKTEVTVLEKKTDHVKGKKSRTVYLGQEIIDIIMLCKENMNPGTIDRFVFRPRRSPTGNMFKPMGKDGINTALKIIARKYPECGLPEDISSHSLRKCFAMKVYEDLGKTEHALMFVSMLLGHKSTTQTRVYIGLDKQATMEYYQSLKFDLNFNG